MQDITRRQALAGGSAALVLVSSAPAISSATTGPDAAIMAAIEKFHALEDRSCAVANEVAAAEFAMRKKLEPPPASIRKYMYQNFGDDIYRWPCSTGVWLRRLREDANHWPPDHPHHAFLTRILADRETYERQCAIARRQCDLDRLEVKQQAALEAIDAALDQTMELPARSLGGVIRKFKLADYYADFRAPRRMTRLARLLSSTMDDMKLLAASRCPLPLHHPRFPSTPSPCSLPRRSPNAWTSRNGGCGPTSGGLKALASRRRCPVRPQALVTRRYRQVARSSRRAIDRARRRRDERRRPARHPARLAPPDGRAWRRHKKAPP